MKEIRGSKPISTEVIAGDLGQSSELPEQTQENFQDNLKLESGDKLQKIEAIKLVDESANPKIQVDKETQEFSLASFDDINELNTIDATENLSLKQCFKDKRIILFDQETFAYYDDDIYEDRISIQNGQVLVYLSIPEIGTAETAHYTYPIPEKYSGTSHNFVFLDKDEDGSIDNTIYAYPKDENFPTNLCRSAPNKPINRCLMLGNENTFQVEFTKELDAGINWVYSQPKYNYTIQLYTTLDLLEADDFIKKHRLQSKAIIFPAISNNNLYFKVVIGNFAQVEDAQREVSTSLNNFQVFQPRVRTFSTYYAEISELATTMICS